MINWSLLIDKLIWFFILILFCSFYIFNANVYSRFILLGITSIILLLEILRYGKSFPLYWHTFHTCIIFFAFFCFLSYFWSIDPLHSLLQASIVFQIFICMSVLYIYFIKQNSIIPLLDIIIWSGYIVALYSCQFYGIEHIKEIVDNANRLENSFINVNSIGMLLAFSSILSVYKILFVKFRWCYLLLFANIVILAATGSRTALVALFLGVSIVFVLKYSTKNFFLSLFRYVLIFILIYFAIYLFLSLSIFDGIRNRMETLLNIFSTHGAIDGSTLTRKWMINLGLHQFTQTPLLGIGVGASGEFLASAIGWRTYFHNNYIELLACGGIIGVVLYYLMFFIPAINLYKK